MIFRIDTAMDSGSCRVLRMMIQVLNQAYSILTPLRTYRILVIIIDVMIENNARKGVQ